MEPTKRTPADGTSSAKPHPTKKKTMNSPATTHGHSATLHGHSATLHGHSTTVHGGSAALHGRSSTLDGYYSPTQPEFHQFHTIDRRLYSAMVFQLRRDPTRALHVLAFILWQERRCSDTIVAKIVDQPLDNLRKLFHHADTCLHCIMDPVGVYSILNGDTPLMDPTPDEFLHELRRAKSEIINVVNTVCLPAVSDLFQKALKNPTCRKKHGGGRWPEGRTMFMTFSKGYPVDEWEVSEFLKSNYGDMVESIHMAAPTETEPQPLNAHIVLRSVDSVNEILGGDLKSVLQFSIHGKDARMRKFDHDRRVNSKK